MQKNVFSKYAREISSFHDDTVRATLAELKKIYGRPSLDPDDYKTQYSWNLRSPITAVTCELYDYKEDRITNKTIVEWHIGAYNSISSKKAKIEIEADLDAYRNRQEMLNQEE
jgi:hypothetical protein